MGVAMGVAFLRPEHGCIQLLSTCDEVLSNPVKVFEELLCLGQLFSHSVTDFRISDINASMLG